MTIKISPHEAEQLHAAAKMIEVDGLGAYLTCCERYGDSVAKAIVITWLRSRHNLVEQYPPPEELVEHVNQILAGAGLMTAPGMWVKLGELRPGAVFETKEGIRAVKSEYHYGDNDPRAQCQCVLLESGEYAHFPMKNATLVREIVLS